MAGKLPGIPLREFQKTLKDNGFSKDRCNGGHEVWKRTQTVSIPAHDKEINGAVARRLTREYGLKK